MLANRPLSKPFYHTKFDSHSPLFGSTSTSRSIHEMPSHKKPNKPKAKATDTTVKFPSLHADVEKALGAVSMLH